MQTANLLKTNTLLSSIQSTQKTISLCIIGKPNAGKSSLLNKIIKQKISIVTPKVQTTRSIITGIITIEDTQIIILDTPGIFEPKKQLEKAMVRCAWSSLHSVDIVMLIIDSEKPLDSFTYQILERLKSVKIKLVFLLNKIDLKSKYLAETVKQLTTDFPNIMLFLISVFSGENIDNLLSYIISQATPTKWLYEADDVTNLPMRFLAAEITREQLFLNLHEELPYNLTVQTEAWEEYRNKSIKINQVIIVSRESYKTIILGKNGAKIKEIGCLARLEMEKSFDCKIHLFLFVKVRDWEISPDAYQHMRLPIKG